MSNEYIIDGNDLLADGKISVIELDKVESMETALDSFFEQNSDSDTAQIYLLNEGGRRYIFGKYGLKTPPSVLNNATKIYVSEIEKFGADNVELILNIGQINSADVVLDGKDIKEQPIEEQGELRNKLRHEHRSTVDLLKSLLPYAVKIRGSKIRVLAGDAIPGNNGFVTNTLNAFKLGRIDCQLIWDTAQIKTDSDFFNLPNGERLNSVHLKNKEIKFLMDFANRNPNSKIAISLANICYRKIISEQES